MKNKFKTKKQQIKRKQQIKKLKTKKSNQNQEINGQEEEQKIDVAEKNQNNAEAKEQLFNMFLQQQNQQVDELSELDSQQQHVQAAKKVYRLVFEGLELIPQTIINALPGGSLVNELYDYAALTYGTLMDDLTQSYESVWNKISQGFTSMIS